MDRLTRIDAENVECGPPGVETAHRCIGNRVIQWNDARSLVCHRENAEVLQRPLIVSVGDRQLDEQLLSSGRRGPCKSVVRKTGLAALREHGSELKWRAAGSYSREAEAVGDADNCKGGKGRCAVWQGSGRF